MAGVFTNVVFNSGLISPASPGSIFAILAMTPKGSYIGVILSVIAATAVSFFVASILLKMTPAAQDEDDDSLEKASMAMSEMKGASKGQASNVNLADVKAVYVACDAGMGSSAMGASLLRKKCKQQA